MKWLLGTRPRGLHHGASAASAHDLPSRAAAPALPTAVCRQRSMPLPAAMLLSPPVPARVRDQMSWIVPPAWARGSWRSTAPMLVKTRCPTR